MLRFVLALCIAVGTNSPGRAQEQKNFDDTLAAFIIRNGLLCSRVVWVRPELVAEVAYRGWTSEGLVRHASFQGLREDKDPREVVRE
jgi:ATP-dependent DNA ligase